jgi:hypothetical protein
VFERYTAEAQRAVRAASEAAALLEHRNVQPLHLLLGCLHVPDSLAARVLEAELAPSDMGTLGEAMERARMYGPNPAHQIEAQDGPARERLVCATRRALGDLQAAIIEHTRQPWPADTNSGRPDRLQAHAEVVGDDINPMLRLWYGDPDNPTLEVTSRPIYSTSVVRDPG